MSELLRQSVLKKMYCVASYFIVKRGNKSTSTSTVLSASSLDNMVIATTPLDFIAERSKGWHLQMSADLPGMDAPGNRLQLAQVVC